MVVESAPQRQNDGDPMLGPAIQLLADESRTDLVVLNTKDGSEAKKISWIKDVTVTSYDPSTKTFQTREGVNLDEGESPVEVFPVSYTHLTLPTIYSV